jgi:hypothetical protein
MADSRRFLSAAVGLTGIIGGAVVGVAVMSNTYAANNFSSTNDLCRIIEADRKSGETLCVCPSAAAYQRWQLQHPGDNDQICLIEGVQNRVSNNPPGPSTTGTTTTTGTTSTTSTNGTTSTTSTNGTTSTTSTNGTTSTTSGGFTGNPGNHKPVGRATEGPPKGTREEHFGFTGGPITGDKHVGDCATCSGGSRGASDN